MKRAPAAMNQSAAYGSRIDPAPRKTAGPPARRPRGHRREDRTGVRAPIRELDGPGAALGQRGHDPDRLLGIVAVEERQHAGSADGIEDLEAARRLIAPPARRRCRRPAPRPRPRDTRFTSPRRECFRHPAATANSIASFGARPSSRAEISPAAKASPAPTRSTIGAIRQVRATWKVSGVQITPDQLFSIAEIDPRCVNAIVRSRESDSPAARRRPRTRRTRPGPRHGRARRVDAEDLVGVLFVADQDVRLGHDIGHHVPGGLAPVPQLGAVVQVDRDCRAGGTSRSRTDDGRLRGRGGQRRA